MAKQNKQQAEVTENVVEAVEAGTVGLNLIEAEAKIAELERRLRGKRPVAVNLCECGCGGRTAGRFVPGHDAKLKSRLLADFRNGDTATSANAEKRMIALGWEKFSTASPKTSKERRNELKAEIERLRNLVEASKAVNS